jgi:hypothetical protein
VFHAGIVTQVVREAVEAVERNAVVGINAEFDCSSRFARRYPVYRQVIFRSSHQSRRHGALLEPREFGSPGNVQGVDAMTFDFGRRSIHYSSSADVRSIGVSHSVANGDLHEMV